MRPTNLSDFIGQEELLGEGHLLRRVVESGSIFSIIFWGPPGSGKTTLARLLAQKAGTGIHELSAVAAGVKEVRKVICEAQQRRSIGENTVLFIDEIHRFSKSQQDALLHAVEDGTITLIGATTENPSFEVISPLLSRCRVLVLKPYTKIQLAQMLDRALKEDIVLSKSSYRVADEARELLLASSGGDARKLFNALEIAISQIPSDATGQIGLELIKEALQERNLLYDRAGDYHYDTISAFIKSVRGSDPDAAIYWLTVMIEGGEKPEFIARRLLILASEDIGNSDPVALTMATSAMQAVHMVGMPEGAIILAQVTTYLAAATKSNAAYMALKKAKNVVKKTGLQDVPLHLRNAPTDLMKNLNYSADYQYPHTRPDQFVNEEYFPNGLKERDFYIPTQSGHEKFITERLKKLWPDRF
jgi:putative ATPase